MQVTDVRGDLPELTQMGSLAAILNEGERITNEFYETPTPGFVRPSRVLFKGTLCSLLQMPISFPESEITWIMTHSGDGTYNIFLDSSILRSHGVTNYEFLYVYEDQNDISEERMPLNSGEVLAYDCRHHKMYAGTTKEILVALGII